jgi:hypothetical protein
MSAATLLLVNGICSFAGAGVGAFLGIYAWLKRNKVVVEERVNIRVREEDRP